MRPAAPVDRWFPAVPGMTGRQSGRQVDGGCMAGTG